MTSEKMRAAFDIRREPAQLRDRYGRHLFGQSALMGRRMVEAGGAVRDRDLGLSRTAIAGTATPARTTSGSTCLPGLDQTLSALLEDLDRPRHARRNARGLPRRDGPHAEGETPRWGRGHWSYCFPALLAGARFAAASRMAALTRTRPTPWTIRSLPRTWPRRCFMPWASRPRRGSRMRLGRPVSVMEGGLPLTELFG